MTLDPNMYVRGCVDGFTILHKQDPRQAYTSVLSVFITAFSIMNTDDRMKCLRTLVIMLNDIGFELFEDGSDFVSFLKDKAEERILTEGEADGKNPNN